MIVDDMDMSRESFFEAVLPVLDRLTLATLKIQQFQKNGIGSVPNELYSEQNNLKDELVELLVSKNAIALNVIKQSEK